MVFGMCYSPGMVRNPETDMQNVSVSAAFHSRKENCTDLEWRTQPTRLLMNLDSENAWWPHS
jgi:hypothetical protein